MPMPTAGTRAGLPSGTLDVAVACADSDWPYRKWLQQDDSLRVRQVPPPYGELHAAPCQVVLLRSRELRRDLPRLLDAMGDHVLPVLLVCPVPDARQIAAAFRLGATSCLTDGEYRGWILKNALRNTAAGHTHLSPVTAAALTRGERKGGGTWPGSTLSPRERQIMDLLTRGCRTTEIAQRLCLAAKTVRNNLSAIYAKLGVSGRTEAVLLWLDAGPEPGPQPARVSPRQLA